MAYAPAAMFNRGAVVDEKLVRYLQQAPLPPSPRDPALPVREEGLLTGRDLVELFESQATCRHLDLTARQLRRADQGYYTIASAGHEGNAVVGRIARITDPAFLHYRSGALMAERARKREGGNFVRDTLLSLVAARDDPASGGRHKVWGSKALWVPPQTSTIASHLPKAVGTAIALARGHRLGLLSAPPADSIVLCSFGEASAHHSTAQGAFSAASFAAHSQVPCPVFFLCEDNSFGISVPTPADWIDTTFGARPHIRYFQADGDDLLGAYAMVDRAVRYCRQRRRPVFMHLRVVRLLGHAGSDFEAAYRTMEEIEASEARDPLLSTARLIVGYGVATPAELLARYEAIRWRVQEEAGLAVSRPKLATPAEIVAPLAPHSRDAVMAEACRTVEDAASRPSPPRHLAAQINRALGEMMKKYPEMFIFGEDVGKKGGVYHLTAGLIDQFGPARVFNTVLDEQTIFGLAQGFGTLGMLPVPEIQYLAYFHNAEDQLRGEACSLQFFSADQFRNPMVVRIASFGYQKGFGGHFHNDNSIAALRDIPGLVIAVPSRGDDSVRMLRTAMAMARVDGRVVAFLEPIALYMTRDLHEQGDGLWTTAYPEQGTAIGQGEGRIYRPEASDLAIITYGNGVYLALRAARWLEREHGIAARVVDLRWLNPLNEAFVAAQARDCGAALIVDEGRRTGGVGEAMIAAIVEHCWPVPRIDRVAGLDSYVPLGPAARLVWPDEHGIVAAGAALLKRTGTAAAPAPRA